MLAMASFGLSLAEVAVDLICRSPKSHHRKQAVLLIATIEALAHLQRPLVICYIALQVWIQATH
jgi:hypothetical protein